MNRSDIPGHGIDADPARRPGVPMERSVAPDWLARPPVQQTTQLSVFRDTRGKRIPPVYGSAQPLKGVSGVMRELAYKYPGHLVRHWLLLLAADRVDVWEHRLGRVSGVTGAVAVVLGSAFAIRRFARA